MSKLYVNLDKDGNVIEKRRYNAKGIQTYYEDSSGIWWKKKYDKNGILVSKESKSGTIVIKSTY